MAIICVKMKLETADEGYVYTEVQMSKAELWLFTAPNTFEVRDSN